MSGHTIKKIIYFDAPGPQNTATVIDAVKDRVKEGDVRYIVVASITGETALNVAQSLKDGAASVTCVSGCPSWQTHGEQYGRVKKYPFIDLKIRKRLEELGARIVDTVPSSLSDSIEYGLARYGFIPASWAVVETLLAIGGYGFKTAVEIVLMATDCGAIPPFTTVISIAGTDRGADTAIVARSTYSPCIFGENEKQRLQILEVLAMPKNKKWYDKVTCGEWNVNELARRQGRNI